MGSESAFASSRTISLRLLKQLWRSDGDLLIFEKADVHHLLLCSANRVWGGGLQRCAKCDRSRPFGYEDKRVAMLCEFGLKMPISPLFSRVLRIKRKLLQFLQRAAMLALQALY